MRPFAKHVAFPALAPASIVGLYFTPVMVFGCVNRGLIAVAVALVSAVLAFVSIARSLSARKRRDPSAWWWYASAVIFTLPLALLVGPLG